MLIFAVGAVSLLVGIVLGMSLVLAEDHDCDCSGCDCGMECTPTCSSRGDEEFEQEEGFLP